jgi:hypothetical protein
MDDQKRRNVTSDTPGQGDEGRSVDDGTVVSRHKTPSPLKAIRRHCLWCCNGSLQEVRLCPAKTCPLWAFRDAKKPTEEELEELLKLNHPRADRMYPQESCTTVAEFHETRGTALGAIKRRCLDCSGYSHAGVRECHYTACDLHPFRMGNNPNRKMNAEQRELAAQRLQANRKKHGK